MNIFKKWRTELQRIREDAKTVPLDQFVFSYKISNEWPLSDKTAFKLNDIKASRYFVEGCWFLSSYTDFKVKVSGIRQPCILSWMICNILEGAYLQRFPEEYKSIIRAERDRMSNLSDAAKKK